jgi:propanol-preferring alcohol dehydrogenase
MPIGIQFAKALGLHVIGIDARDEGLNLSKEMGSDIVIDARKGKEEAVKEVHAITGGLGADASICLSDHKDAASIACSVTKMHGTMIAIAQPEKIIIPFQEIVFRDIRIHGSLLCSAEESKKMVECIAEHGVKVRTNIFHGLDKIEQLVNLVQSGKLEGKAVIVVDQDQLEHEKSIGAKY